MRLTATAEHHLAVVLECSEHLEFAINQQSHPAAPFESDWCGDGALGVDLDVGCDAASGVKGPWWAAAYIAPPGRADLIGGVGGPLALTSVASVEERHNAAIDHWIEDDRLRVPPLPGFDLATLIDASSDPVLPEDVAP